jgi:hypothetical protein
MASSLDDSKISDNFPHKFIPPIVGQPTYETIKDLHLKLNENAVKVHSNLGNGLLGYLGVTVTPAIYNTLSAIPFDIPVNPGVAPVIPAGATGPAIHNIRVTFKEDFAAFKKYQDVCNAISALILTVIDPVYLAALRLPYIGFGTRTPLELLAHLYANYAKITPADLDQNDQAMKQPCDVNQPIEVLFKQIDDAVEFASAGGTPYSTEQILAVAYQLVFRTGIFTEDCKIWKRQGAVGYKTWPQFKLDFALAYQEYNEALQINPSAAGFHAPTISDHNEETIAAIANLATATAEDRRALANLTGTNATLTKELATSNGKLITALTLITSLNKQLADLRAGGNNNTTRTPTPGGERKHYCWTCGYKSEHSSWYCPTPATGHQTRAKAADTMNGSIKNKP